MKISISLKQNLVFKVYYISLKSINKWWKDRYNEKFA